MKLPSGNIPPPPYSCHPSRFSSHCWNTTKSSQIHPPRRNLETFSLTYMQTINQIFFALSYELHRKLCKYPCLYAYRFFFFSPVLLNFPWMCTLAKNWRVKSKAFSQLYQPARQIGPRGEYQMTLFKRCQKGRDALLPLHTCHRTTPVQNKKESFLEGRTVFPITPNCLRLQRSRFFVVCNRYIL